MSPLAYAMRNFARQPARSALGVLGITAVGALLFDMLLLSNGLLLSFEDLLDSVGYDVRVTATPALPGMGAPIEQGLDTMRRLSALDELDRLAVLRFGSAFVTLPDGSSAPIAFMATAGDAHHSWTLLRGREIAEAGAALPELLVNENLARDLELEPEGTVLLEARCERAVALPRSTFRVAGVVRFAFETADERSAVTRIAWHGALCGDEGSESVDLIVASSADGVSAEEAVTAIRQREPNLYAFSNEQFLARFQRESFSYFRQISRVLTVITLFFSVLLITSLLSVAVNQRFGEIAALRAMGFSRRRVVQDLVMEAVLFTGLGGLLSLPVGAVLAVWLDAILRDVPGLPARLHFFVYDPRALVVHAALMGLTAVLAVIYPTTLAVRLPIAATLRDEVAS